MQCPSFCFGKCRRFTRTNIVQFASLFFRQGFTNEKVTHVRTLHSLRAYVSRQGFTNEKVSHIRTLHSLRACVSRQDLPMKKCHTYGHCIVCKLMFLGRESSIQKCHTYGYCVVCKPIDVLPVLLGPKGWPAPTGLRWTRVRETAHGK